ncbi:unnamed protein product, partial [Mesorhabditis spiculigera]
MLMKLLCFAGLFAVAAAGSCPSSTLQLISKCYTPYLKFFGASCTSKTLPSYTAWTIPRELMYQNGSSSVFPVCSVTKTLYACLGNNAPLSLDCYQAMGLSAVEASVYRTDLSAMQFQCTAGVNALYSTFDCYRAASVTYNAAIQKCETDYAKNVQSDVCKAMNTMMDCKSSIYGKQCGTEAKSLNCGIVRTALNLLDGSCSASGKLNKCAACH